ncbi:MAG: 30S ribosomal protein S12 methylthiotransferase RimO [Clostridiales bacterium]|nr:30S ribosomal protein S12 methylthiotransferase RimO [Clostridiales bacterium]
MNVGFVSLGCSKNLVDTEMTIGLFKEHNYNIVANPENADIIVINTCGFIESAKQEAINTILEMAEYKSKKCKFLIVMGCLVQRYKDELMKAIPEVDLFIKYQEYNTIWEQIEKVIGNNKNSNSKEYTLSFNHRIISTGQNYAYLRIAEGCDNKCTYCAIPYIRGKFVSRKIEDIIDEANELVKNGYRELIVIAQDTSKYGIDIYGVPKLAELLEKLSKIESLKWIRFLYTYPESITDELIKVVKENIKICKYFDIPIQHISDSVLKRMNRKSNGVSIKNIISKIRKEIPNVIIRTTVMVGFPGETEKDFAELYDFIKNTKFERLGAFAYSLEDGTPAEKLEGHIHHNTKRARHNKIMKLQNEISENIMKKQIGNTFEVLVEDVSFDGKYYIARSQNEVPDIDGIIYVEKDMDELFDKFITVKIIDNKDYDLIAKIIHE